MSIFILEIHKNASAFSTNKLKVSVYNILFQNYMKDRYFASTSKIIVPIINTPGAVTLCMYLTSSVN